MKYLFYISLFIFPLTSCFSKHDTSRQIPSIKILLTDSASTFSTQFIKEGTPTILAFFDPDCDHCKEMTADLINNMNFFKSINIIYLTTNQSLFESRAFYQYYHLSQYPNIHYGIDTAFKFLKFFQPHSTPYIAIYDKDKDLRFTFDGGTSVSNMEIFLKKLSNE